MASLNAPLSVQELTAQASNYEYNAFIPLKNWLRTASTMQKEAQVYEAEGNDPQTYLLLYRHANLVLEHLQNHPEKSKPENRKALGAATAAVGADLKKLEDIRPRIKKRHAEYLERREAQLKALQSLEGRDASLAHEFDGLGLNQGHRRRSYERPALDAEGNQSLAARLAQREVKRRDAARRNVRQAGVSEEEEHERRTAGLWGDWETELGVRRSEGDDGLQDQFQEVARLQQGDHKAPNFSRPTSIHALPYNYPTVPHHGQDEWAGTDARLSSPNAPIRPPKERIPRPPESLPPALPPKPPKPSTPTVPFEQPRSPPVPGKYADPATIAPPIPSKQPARPASPAQDLDDFSFKPSAYLENGEPLRTVFLPSQLRALFLQCAIPNTRQNLETCGILCGILKSNALFITRLVIPAQTSTSDTCEMTNESDLFDYCDSEELMVLGWIHTHPTQTCFMSSRDLHTHVGYQVMMAESIAIVCAPSKSPEWGCFRLTDPPGKQAILSCNKPGIFHPHEVENIYTEALKPGHVVELRSAPLEVVDMRKRR